MPRVSFSLPPDFPVPESFVSGPELIEYVIGTWWGANLSAVKSTFEGFEISHGSPLGRSATSGLSKACTMMIRDACIADELQASVPSDPANPLGGYLRFTPADWRATSLIQAKTDLNTGRVFRLRGEPSAWANAKPLMFREEQCEEWLRSLKSPYVMCESPFADPTLLPDRSYVMLCEATRWLSGRSVISKEGLEHERIENNARLHALDDGRTAETDKAYPPGPDFDADVWFAELLAVQPKIDFALKALTDAIVSGSLEAFGQRAKGQSNEKEVAKVDPDIFMTGVCLQYQHDEISADGAADIERYGEARNAGYWKEVRFRRSDLVSIWGDASNDTGEAATATEVRAERVTRIESDANIGVRGRPNVGDAFALKYVELFPSGHQRDGLRWKEAIRRVCDEFEVPPVDQQTLARALGKLKQF